MTQHHREAGGEHEHQRDDQSHRPDRSKKLVALIEAGGAVGVHRDRRHRAGARSER